MNLHQAGATILVPDQRSLSGALARVTHLGIGAHQDDLEIMAFHGIAECHGEAERWFGGITCTDGAGSPRSGPYADLSDERMKQARAAEQEEAARIGGYGFLAQLDYPSQDLEGAGHGNLRADLAALLQAAAPSVVYTHNPADKHDSHVAVVVAAIDAIRGMRIEERPAKVLGCEVWRGLDWLGDEEVVRLDVGGDAGLAQRVVDVFQSQIAAGKRYDLATIGRRRANATFASSHEVDECEQVWLAMDLSPLVQDETLDLAEYVGGCLDRFSSDVASRLQRMRSNPAGDR